MKKFIFTANVIALLILVPAVMVGYLHSNQTDSASKTANQEITKQANTSSETGNFLRIVKSY
jgi:hypothetical protein